MRVARVTGSGKTFAMAHVIEQLNIPTLIMSHNKTLARQLHQEMVGYFPDNAVEYFVSHYDYYQPEAYLAKRDLYIDKELSINERIEQERFAVASWSPVPIASWCRQCRAFTASTLPRRSSNTICVATLVRRLRPVTPA